MNLRTSLPLLGIIASVYACATSSLEERLTVQRGCIGVADVPANGTKEDAIRLAKDDYRLHCLGGRELADNADIGMQYQGGKVYIYSTE